MVVSCRLATLGSPAVMSIWTVVILAARGLSLTKLYSRDSTALYDAGKRSVSGCGVVGGDEKMVLKDMVVVR